jgi:hypothetical protein
MGNTAGVPLAAGLIAGLTLFPALHAYGADPYASNNGFYPNADQWSGPFRTINADYPTEPVQAHWKPGGPVGGAITTTNANRFLAALKAAVEPSMRKMVESPDSWDPTREGWYDMIWTGAGSDPCGGRDSILGSYSGQKIERDSFAASGLTVDMQNFTLIYYDRTAATMLARLWADPFRPDVTGAQFPEGAMVVKVGAVTPTPAEWPVVDGASVWNVYWPKLDPAKGHCVYDAKTNPPVVQQVRVLQFDVIVKDSVASPQTGWIFTTFVYDKDAPGKDSWDKLVPLGAQWGNDPEYALEPDGNGPDGELRETWINPEAPAYAFGTLGWGGRLSGPIDVSQRHNVVQTDGKRVAKMEASSCMSCHSTAQFPFTANLYPSPNITFPPEGEPFLMYPPGSEQWARWNQNRDGTRAISPNRAAVGLDYDMLVTFALGTVNAVIGDEEYSFEHPRAH